MIESQFLIELPFIFPVPLLVPHREVLFMISISTVIHSQLILWWTLLLAIIILMKNKYIRTTGLLEVTVMEG